jgi:uncharacterized iron-regulated membrane protein
MSATPSPAERQGHLYRMLWRWHFYAGLFCIPFVIALALTGSVYLFRPQIEDWIDRDLMALERTGEPATQAAIVAAATNSIPGSTFSSIVLTEHPDQAARVIVSKSGERTRVYVHPDTLAILKSVREEDRFGRVVFRMHGELLLGPNGGYFVELAACWAIVMVITGLYLWWPRSARGLGGVLYPRLRDGPKRFWRDIHAVTGVWVSVFALFLLVTGLPWATVWGASFKQVREWTGTAPISTDWFTSSADEHAHHMAEDAGHTDIPHGASLDQIVVSAAAMHLAAPVLVQPPSLKTPYWQVKSDAANRPERTDIYLSPMTGEVVARQGFADKHVLDQAVAVGIAAHEGHLFGWVNQLLGLLTAMGLILLSVSAFVMWRRRAPAGVLGAPPPIPDSRIGVVLGSMIGVCAILLPLLGVCLIAIALLEWVVLKRLPPVRRWLGLSQT